jgi:hypothetical protein
VEGQLQPFLASTPDSDERPVLCLDRLIPRMKGHLYPRTGGRVDPRECERLREDIFCNPAGLCAPNRPHCALLYVRLHTNFRLGFFFTLPI